MKKKSEPGLALLSPALLVLALVGFSGLVSLCLAWARAQPFWARLDWAKPVLAV